MLGSLEPVTIVRSQSPKPTRAEIEAKRRIEAIQTRKRSLKSAKTILLVTSAFQLASIIFLCLSLSSTRWVENRIRQREIDLGLFLVESEGRGKESISSYCSFLETRCSLGGSLRSLCTYRSAVLAFLFLALILVLVAFILALISVYYRKPILALTSLWLCFASLICSILGWSVFFLIYSATCEYMENGIPLTATFSDQVLLRSGFGFSVVSSIFLLLILIFNGLSYSHYRHARRQLHIIYPKRRRFNYGGHSNAPNEAGTRVILGHSLHTPPLGGQPVVFNRKSVRKDPEATDFSVTEDDDQSSNSSGSQW